MSKKHFIALVGVLRAAKPNNIHDQDIWASIVHSLAGFCQTQNPLFKRQRWLDYIDGKCGPNGGYRNE